MNGPFPVLAKLKCLKLSGIANNQLDFFRTNVPNLHSLYMSCETNRELEVWRHLSGQLKLAHMCLSNSTYFSHFLELTFPHLVDFAIGQIFCRTTDEIASSRGNDFFPRHSLLRRLSVSVPIPVQWIRSISCHCPGLTSLSLTLVNPEEGILASLVLLTKLRHLLFLKSEFIYENRSEYTNMHTKLFRGTIKSLESVELEIHPSRNFLENLLEAASQLKRLDIKLTFYDSLLLDVEFICENFSCLRRLEVDMCNQTPADDSVRFDKLEHLEELTICNALGISYIHRNNVRCLKICFHLINNEDLGQIAEKFPLLKRLTFEFCSWLSVSGIIQLHKMIPSCTIDYGSQRFYPDVYP
ncbi:uncharacterized protein LOC131208323 [Anopheles bellator]|uniref:uncharacterized protein LOC131208323 n=1 Tax=Anopheles bellator TaxID=139047 RepID=UPI002647E6FF|nr:uncharacterized protein LOC131208323 [Anopheles bellator]